MDWWSKPGVWIFIFALAFLIMLKEWFKAHDLISKIKKESDEFANKMKTTHWDIVNKLEAENLDLKRRLGRK